MKKEEKKTERFNKDKWLIHALMVFGMDEREKPHRSIEDSLEDVKTIISALDTWVADFDGKTLDEIEDWLRSKGVIEKNIKDLITHCKKAYDIWFA